MNDRPGRGNSRTDVLEEYDPHHGDDMNADDQHTYDPHAYGLDDGSYDDPVFDQAGEHESVSLIRRAIEVIAAAKPLPLSSSVRIEPGEVLDLLEDALERLPEELRQARWLLKEREDFLQKVQREADDILEAARDRAERMVQRAEVVKGAKREAQRIVDTAEADSRRLRHEAEDFCDQQLARFEIVLERTMKTVKAGREKLRVSLPDSVPDTGFTSSEAESAFFDQDEDTVG